MNILALDLGGSSLKRALVDEKATIKNKRIVLNNCNSYEDVLDLFDEAVTNELDDVEGIAISMPGKIDISNGTAISAGAYTPFLAGRQIRKVIEERYERPVIVENDGKCAAIAESWKGSLQGKRNAIVYIIGTGLGGGLIINGGLYRGSHHSAGEISVTSIDLKDDYSREKAVASMLGIRGLIRLYRENNGGDGVNDGISFFDHIKEKDEAAVRSLDRFCELHASYIFDLQAILDVESVAIGGGISQQESLIKKIREVTIELFRKRGSVSVTCPDIIRCHYLSDANLVGATKMFLDHYGRERN